MHTNAKLRTKYWSLPLFVAMAVPGRDGVIDEIEAGLTESEWTSRVLGRPVTKAFNNILTGRIIDGGLPKGSENRIALPVSGEDLKAKQLVIALMDDMGFDGIDAGPLSESWRQEPVTPAYCTDYNVDGLKTALASADRARSSHLRDLSMEKAFSLPPGSPASEIVRIVRGLTADQLRKQRTRVRWDPA